MNEFEMPKLKVKLSRFEVEELRRKKKTKNFILFFLVVIFSLFGGFYFYLKSFHKEVVIILNETSIEKIDILSYKQEDNIINLSLKPSNEQEYCTFSKEEVDKNTLEFSLLNDNYCNINVPFEKVYVYFKNNKGIISDPLELNNYVVDFDVKDKYYFPLNKTGKFMENMIVVGEPKVEIVSSTDAISLNNNEYSSNTNGKTVLTVKNGTLQQKEFEVVVTDAIVEMPKEFDTKKNFLACEQFSEEDAALLDEILAYRISEAGYGTRAGAVAAARFLTLEFPYKISYYFENGRLNGTGTHYVDGEGRYYHQGLYLSKSKYDQLVPGARLRGPQMWGCKMRSYEDDRDNGYIPGGKYPNGLDCSGFVSWTLLNGGQDVGDGGAGESPAIKGQMTDTGEYKKLTQGMINRGEVRVGDLLNIYGHIAIIAGDDGENFYVAESLNNYKGVVLKKYSKKKVINWFPYVVLMDSVYNGDGNLTNMWY